MPPYRDAQVQVEEKASVKEQPFFCYFVMTINVPNKTKGKLPEKDECYATFKVYALDKFEALNIAQQQIKARWKERFDSFQAFEVIGLEDFGWFTARRFWSNVKLISVVSFTRTREIRVLAHNHTDKYLALKEISTVNPPEFVTKDFLENMIGDDLV
jgi:hypothetical protein